MKRPPHSSTEVLNAIVDQVSDLLCDERPAFALTSGRRWLVQVLVAASAARAVEEAANEGQLPERPLEVGAHASTGDEDEAGPGVVCPDSLTDHDRLVGRLVSEGRAHDDQVKRGPAALHPHRVRSWSGPPGGGLTADEEAARQRLSTGPASFADAVTVGAALYRETVEGLDRLRLHEAMACAYERVARTGVPS